MNTLRDLQRELESLANPAKAAVLKRFFKTGPGEYGEGDRFRGIKVPETRKLAKAYSHLSIQDATTLLKSPWHEDRLLALFLLIQHYRKADATSRNAIHRLYLDQIGKGVNNWDLVDSSAEYLVGAHLEHNDISLLEKLARDKNLWKRRVAMIATFHFIKRGEYAATLRIAEILLADKHDLIHKAVGWMLRETGKRNPAVERRFLDRHAVKMPRTALRYAIEKFPESERKKYLALKPENR